MFCGRAVVHSLLVLLGVSISISSRFVLVLSCSVLSYLVESVGCVTTILLPTEKLSDFVSPAKWGRRLSPHSRPGVAVASLSAGLPTQGLNTASCRFFQWPTYI